VYVVLKWHAKLGVNPLVFINELQFKQGFISVNMSIFVLFKTTHAYFNVGLTVCQLLFTKIYNISAFAR
jgi:hypothetical protein